MALQGNQSAFTITDGKAEVVVIPTGDAVPGKNKKIKVSRKLEGRHEIVESKLPALLTVVREINKPRYASVPMRLDAQDMSVALWDNKVMNLDVNQIGLKGSPTAVRKIFSPERDKGEIVGDGANDPNGTAKVLVEKLIQRELLAL